MKELQLYINDLNCNAEIMLTQTYKEILLLSKDDFFDSGLWAEYLTSLSAWILRLLDLQKAIADGAWLKYSLSEVEAVNATLYSELLAYEDSWANPSYAIEKLGTEYGTLAAWLKVRYRDYIDFAFTNKVSKLVEWNQIFIDFVNLFKTEHFNAEAIQTLITKPLIECSFENYQYDMYERYSTSFASIKSVVLNADLSTDRYLYNYGKYISSNEKNLSAFFRTYPQDKLKALAKNIFDSFLFSFELERKALTNKKTFRIMFYIGQEALVRTIITYAETKGMYAILSIIQSTSANQQYDFDIRFNDALFLNEKYASNHKALLLSAYKANEILLKEYAGVLIIESFGEDAFNPIMEKEVCCYSTEQQKIKQSMNKSMMDVVDMYLPKNEKSFCAVAFPSPSIGKDFEEIFEGICTVNMMNSDECCRLQEKIITELDKANFVEIVGAAGNKTHIMIALQPLKDAEKYSNFNNCGTGVNIPVGEVFTSPQLAGTNGVLHIPETYLWGMKYIDLVLTFKDGWLDSYTCANFPSAEENKKYIQDSLLSPHETLPLGEFAIGTNTLAYVIANKYQLLEKIHPLIGEKMGPHFAIGDTCYSHEEDYAVFNPYTGKEYVSRENEVSAKRKIKPEEAYFYLHTDITLPYESLAFIRSVQANDQKVDIIKDGRFVLAGTEVLNDAFSSKYAK